jgi:flavocytochrome c
MSYKQVIVVGGGLAGLSAAHTVLENGGSTLVLDKMPFFGGNSTKATSGINGAGTATQRSHNIPDTPEIFENDTKVSAKEGYNAELVRVLTHESGPGVEWLMQKFGLDLSLVSRLGGHSQPRTHRGKERFPGMTITYALMEKYEAICEQSPERARMVTKAKVTRVLSDASGAAIGVEYEKDGKKFTEEGAVVIATGGFGADFSQDSLLQKWSQEWRGLSAWNDVKHLPSLMDLPTTNGDHCTGDGVKLSEALGADTVDMEAVQVHPTGLVHPEEPDAKLKFLAAEALRGVGGILINKHGERFCDDLGKRDYVTARMWNNEGPFRLVLNSRASAEIEWHCKHYMGRGLMKHFASGRDLAKEMGISADKLEGEFRKYNEAARTKNDPFGKKFFHNTPLSVDDHFHVAIVTPVVHYTMGGLKANADSEVEGKRGVIPALYAAGEVMGGVHGKNRLGGNSLLDCVAFGRVAGRSAARFLLQHHLKAAGAGGAAGRLASLTGHVAPISVQVDPATQRVSIDINLGGGSAPAPAAAAPAPAEQAAPAEAAAPAAAAPAKASGPALTMEEVAKHNTEADCWVVVNGEVLDVTGFLNDHPGGKKAILLYAGKDASEEFNMLHKPDVVKKYAAECILGNLAK